MEQVAEVSVIASKSPLGPSDEGYLEDLKTEVFHRVAASKSSKVVWREASKLLFAQGICRMEFSEARSEISVVMPENFRANFQTTPNLSGLPLWWWWWGGDFWCQAKNFRTLTKISKVNFV
jgi:hypothetical protein